MNWFLIIGIILVLGMLGGIAIRKIKFPLISGFILIGMLLSPSVSGIFSSKTIEGISEIVTPIALAVIAYLIGGNLFVGELKKMGKSLPLVTLFQGIGAWLSVTFLISLFGLAALYFEGLNFLNIDLNSYLALGILAGAISLATAPAVTVAIAHENKAKGSFKTFLFGVVALDDVLAIVCFIFATSFAVLLTGAQAGFSLIEELGKVGLEIALSLGLGALVAFVLIKLSAFLKERNETLALVLGAVVFCAGLAQQLGLQPLLAAMILGFIVVNVTKAKDRMIDVIGDAEILVYALFFTLAGAHFDLGILKAAGLVAVLIVLGRCGGKFFGVWTGAKISNAPAVVRKYLGLALFPKAGVTLGLTMLVVQNPQLSGIAEILINAVLASVVINELVAPPLTKYALGKAARESE